MSEHGYDTEGRAYGEALANTAAELARARATARSTQLGATDDLYERYDRYWPHFQLTMQHAVNHLQGQIEYLDLLGLHESRLNGSGTSQIVKPGKNDKFEETLNWLINFYERIQNHREILTILTTYGFPAEKLAKDASSFWSHPYQINTKVIKSVQVRNVLPIEYQNTDAQDGRIGDKTAQNPLILPILF
jgi:hypothetical protein